jgi:hypothetical protein
MTENALLEWCVGNVVGRNDARANVYPRKDRPEQKNRRGRGSHHGDCTVHGRETSHVGLRDAGPAIRGLTHEFFLPGMGGG